MAELSEDPTGPRPWRDPPVAAALGVLVLLQVGALLTARRTSDVWLVVDIVSATLGLAGVVLLLRRPVPGGVLLGLLAALSPAATPTATCGTFTVAQYRRFRVAAGVAAVSTLAHVVQGVIRPVPGLSLAWWVVLVVVAHATLVGWGSYLQARRGLLRSLHDRAERAESEQARRVAEARVLERTRIAREMHDVLAHRLSLLATYAGALEYRPDSSPERLAEAAGVVRAGVHQALDELRDVIVVLRDDQEAEGAAIAGPQPSLADLPGLVEENRAAGMRVELHCDAVDLAAVPAANARTAYRVVQEGMTNARRHAPGQPVTVTVAGRAQGGLEVRVVNPIGPPVVGSPGGSGTGLVGLAERVSILGGALEHGRVEGRFRLAARLPWPT